MLIVRYQDSILQLESEKDKFESMKSMLQQQYIHQSRGEQGIEHDFDNESTYGTQNIKVLEQVCTDQREEITQLKQAMQSLQSSLTLNEKKLMALQSEADKHDFESQARRDESTAELQQRVTDIKTILMTTQEQLAAERRSHELAVGRYIQQISEFETLLCSTRTEFQAKVTEALSNRDAQAAHSETLRAAIQELHEREQVNRSAEQARIIETERFISALKSDALAKDNRLVNVIHLFQ